MGLWVDKEAESEGGAWKKEKRKRRKSVRVKRELGKKRTREWARRGRSREGQSRQRER